MKRKENKIPLVLTVVALLFFIYWAMGYVAKNRTPQPAPTVEMARPANITQIDPPRQAPQAVSQPVVPPPAPAQPADTSTVVYIDPDKPEADSDNPAANRGASIDRKEAAIADVAGNRH